MKLPIRSTRCLLDGDYAGIEVIVRTNVPIRVYQEMDSQKFDSILAALAEMTVSSNVTDDNDVSVDLTTVDGWREMPPDLLLQVVTRIKETAIVPKANENGSATHSSPVTEPSRSTTT